MWLFYFSLILIIKWFIFIVKKTKISKKIDQMDHIRDIFNFSFPVNSPFSIFFAIEMIFRMSEFLQTVKSNLIKYLIKLQIKFY